MEICETYDASEKFLDLGKNSFERIYKSRPTPLFWPRLRIKSSWLFHRCKFFWWKLNSHAVFAICLCCQFLLDESTQIFCITLQGSEFDFDIVNSFPIYFYFLLFWKLGSNLNVEISIQRSNFKHFILRFEFSVFEYCDGEFDFN